jgi:hypothetical protein
LETNRLGSALIFEELLREGGRRKVSMSRLFPLQVIKDFGVVQNRVFCVTQTS